jgi:tRNA-dihydrouridine synthase A
MTDVAVKNAALEARRLSVAPMMDWTDRNCRLFHREISRHSLLYTEMVTAPAVINGKRNLLLDYHEAEHPIALQLGGSDPRELGEAVRIAGDWGYDEINLNCGCPSDRVQSGAFGAVLMKTPDLVADCVAAMRAQSDVEVTVKCRIGVDDQEPRDILPRFLETVAAAGVNRFTIHARKAWLQGLSPKDNREIPPLDYELVKDMKAEFPHLDLSINGGVATLDAAKELLAQGMDGVMIGRAAYHEPFNILGEADAVFGVDGLARDPFEIADIMRAHIARHMERGGKLHQFTRHMLGLFHGRPNARQWKRILSERASGGDLSDYDAALQAVRLGAQAAEG